MLKNLFLLAALPVLASATSFYLTVAGKGGEPDYEQRFTAWANDAGKAFATETGAKVETLTGANATKANMEAKLADIAKQAKADDTFVLLLIGHGAWDDLDYKFNLPGVDISAVELSFDLERIAAKQMIVVGTSAGGAAIPKLQKDKRVVVSATKAGSERNAATFARFFVEGLRDPAADTDKNNTLTALEAYNYAQTKTQEFYKSLKRLATEHSVLEDTGKKPPADVPSVANGQGMLAGHFAVLHVGAAAAAMANPAKQALLKRREELETQIDDLKYHKAAMDQREFDQKYRPLVLELAKVQADLDK